VKELLGYLAQARSGYLNNTHGEAIMNLSHFSQARESVTLLEVVLNCIYVLTFDVSACRQMSELQLNSVLDKACCVGVFEICHALRNFMCTPRELISAIFILIG
jgi:hypothetical protein